MSSSEEGHPITSESDILQRVKTRRTRILIGVLSAVLVVAAVGICAAAFSRESSGSKPTLLARNVNDVNLESMSDNEQETEEDRESLAPVRVARGAYTGPPEPVTPQNGGVTTNARFAQEASCSSSSSSDTIAAAHIKGQGHAFPMSTRDTNALPYLPAGYQQRWQCSEYVDMNMRRKHAHAFVDGGMWFNQTDKSLYVPTCGYYYVYSQITFKCSSPLTASKSVFHNLKFERNCHDWVDAIPPVVQGTSTIGPFTDSTQAGRTTTHTGDIVKLCQGGRMWVEIPDGENGVPCPPWGDDESTFIGAVLIANTTCHWPPQMTLSNLRHS